MTVLLLILIGFAAGQAAEAPTEIERLLRHDYAQYRFTTVAATYAHLDALEQDAARFSDPASPLRRSGGPYSASALDCRHVAVLFSVRAVKLADNEAEYRDAFDQVTADHKAALEQAAGLQHQGADAPDWPARIRVLVSLDQFWRGRVSPPQAGRAPWRTELANAFVWPYVCLADQASTAALKALLEDETRFNELIEDAVTMDQLWILAQHSPDPEIQTGMLELAWDRAERGLLDPSRPAMLADRIALRRGEPQQYGTQGTCGRNGTWRLAGLYDPGAIAANRTRIGMPPLAPRRCGD